MAETTNEYVYILLDDDRAQEILENSRKKDAPGDPIAHAIAENRLGEVQLVSERPNTFWLNTSDRQKKAEAFDLLKRFDGVERISLTRAIDDIWPVWSEKKILPQLVADQISIGGARISVGGVRDLMCA